MLTVTDRAVAAIRDLMVGEYLPHQAGLRISTKPDDPGALEFSLVSTAFSGDEVAAEADVRVFVAPEAVPSVRDKTLDAQAGPRGRPIFRLAPRR